MDTSLAAYVKEQPAPCDVQERLGGVAEGDVDLVGGEDRGFAPVALTALWGDTVVHYFVGGDDPPVLEGWIYVCPGADELWRYSRCVRCGLGFWFG
jgi:hypothetical protein